MSIEHERAIETPRRRSARLQRALRRLPEGGLEQQAVHAGEIDAVVDYANANVIMFPAARRALRLAAASHDAVATLHEAHEGTLSNNLLAALPSADCERLLRACEKIKLRSGEVLHEAGVPIRYVYFPIDCALCLATRTENQRSVGTGMVGYEGMLGLSPALGVDVSPVRASVLTGGTALRMTVECFHREFDRGLPLQRELYRYAYTKLSQARQTAACIDSHSIGQRVACWLLMTSDRSRSPDIEVMHTDLAEVLNVRRESVTQACGALRERRLISYTRGMIRLLNRKGLEAASCACYTKIEAVHASQA